MWRHTWLTPPSPTSHIVTNFRPPSPPRCVTSFMDGPLSSPSYWAIQACHKVLLVGATRVFCAWLDIISKWSSSSLGMVMLSHGNHVDAASFWWPDFFSYPSVRLSSIHRSSLISVLSCNHSYLLINVQASAPYIINGLIIVLYTFPLRWIGKGKVYKTMIRLVLTSMAEIVSTLMLFVTSTGRLFV